MLLDQDETLAPTDPDLEDAGMDDASGGGGHRSEDEVSDDDAPGTAEQAEDSDGDEDGEKLDHLPQQEGINRPLAARIIRHLTSDSNLESSRNKAYNQGSAATFAYLCTIIDISYAGVNLSSRDAKSKLFDLLTTSVSF